MAGRSLAAFGRTAGSETQSVPDGLSWEILNGAAHKLTALPHPPRILFSMGAAPHPACGHLLPRAEKGNPSHSVGRRVNKIRRSQTAATIDNRGTK